MVLDPYDHRFHWDPYPYYRAAREHDPVYFYEPGGFWLLTKWDDVYRAFRDHKTFINSGAIALEKDANEKLPYPLFIGSDPPGAHAPARGAGAADDAGGARAAGGLHPRAHPGAAGAPPAAGTRSTWWPISPATCRWT